MFSIVEFWRAMRQERAIVSPYLSHQPRASRSHWVRCGVATAAVFGGLLGTQLSAVSPVGAAWPGESLWRHAASPWATGAGQPQQETELSAVRSPSRATQEPTVQLVGPATGRPVSHTAETAEKLSGAAMGSAGRSLKGPGSEGTAATASPPTLASLLGIPQLSLESQSGWDAEVSRRLLSELKSADESEGQPPQTPRLGQPTLGSLAVRGPQSNTGIARGPVPSSRDGRSPNVGPISRADSLWDGPEAPPFSDALSGLLKGSDYPRRARPETNDPSQMAGADRADRAIVDDRMGGNPLRSGTRHPERAGGVVAGSSMTRAPRAISPPMDARPLLQTNQRSESLLGMEDAESLLNGGGRGEALVLDSPPAMRGPSDDPIAAPDLEVREPRRPLDRPLSESITSPNLPMRSGFGSRESLEEMLAEESTQDVRNRLSTDEFSALSQQYSERQAKHGDRGLGQRASHARGDVSETMAEVRPVGFNTSESGSIELVGPTGTDSVQPDRLPGANSLRAESGSWADTEIESNPSGLREPARHTFEQTERIQANTAPVGEASRLNEIRESAGLRERNSSALLAGRLKAPVQIDVETLPYLRLYDFDQLRRGLGWASGDVPDPDSAAWVTSQLSEAQYWNWRQSPESAWSRLKSIDLEQAPPAQRWEYAWQLAQIGIGLRQPTLLTDSAALMADLYPIMDASSTQSGLEVIYQQYVAGYRLMSQPTPDYEAASEKFQGILRTIAEKIGPMEGGARQRMVAILLDCQLAMGRCVALGPFQNPLHSADQWYQQAGDTVEQLIQLGEAQPATRIHVVLEQVDIFAKTGRFREIPPLINYLRTWEYQLREAGQMDEARWLESRVTGALLQSSLMAYHFRDYASSKSWAQESSARLSQKPTDPAQYEFWQRSTATAYWLQGALALQAGEPHRALASFDVALKHWSVNGTELPTAHTLEAGEQMAIMAVAYWTAERVGQAMALGETSVQVIQAAIDEGLAEPARLDVPASNWYEMTQAVARPEMQVGGQTEAAMMSASVPTGDGLAATELEGSVSEEQVTQSNQGVARERAREFLEHPATEPVNRDATGAAASSAEAQRRFRRWRTR